MLIFFIYCQQGFASKHGFPLLMNVTIVGVSSKPSVVALNGSPANFTSRFIKDTLVLYVTGLNVTMDTKFNLDWI